MTHRVRPKGSARRTAVGARRTVAGRTSSPQLTLDDRPLSLVLCRDGKRLVVTMPYEVWVVSASLEVERAIPLQSARPSVHEGEEGVLWIGGQHLHRSSVFGSAATKIGTKLGGFVDRVCQIRPRVLCGVGTQGEILWDLEKEDVIHRRKASEHPVLGLVRSADGRAVWTGGESHAWVIDPDHASGYTKLKLKQTSVVEVPGEAIVALGNTADGACVLAARDGAVAWTNRALRMVEERIPRVEGNARPLAVAADDHYIYVLRPAGVLHRFLYAPLPEAEGAADDEPPPEVEQCRLRRLASCLTVMADGNLVLGGPHADDQLGRLWTEEPAALTWEPLRTTKRKLIEEAPPPVEGPAKVPSFVATRSKVAGEAISTIGVDGVLAAKPSLWITRSSGTMLERPVLPATPEEVMPGDAVVMPAMVRMQEGTARPALLVWPGVADDDRDVPNPQWLVWGDRPRGWMPLRTPEIRAQGWSRRDVFPLQVALAQAPPELPGRRASLPDRWVDAELFTALGRECKKLLKVLW